jgi:LacI family transcriptional regulator
MRTIAIDVRSRLRALGRQSNPLAHSTITGRTHAIGLATVDIANPRFPPIAARANRVARRRDCMRLLVDTDDDRARERPLTETRAYAADAAHTTYEPTLAVRERPRRPRERRYARAS